MKVLLAHVKGLIEGSASLPVFKVEASTKEYIEACTDPETGEANGIPPLALDVMSKFKYRSMQKRFLHMLRKDMDEIDGGYYFTENGAKMMSGIDVVAVSLWVTEDGAHYAVKYRNGTISGNPAEEPKASLEEAVQTVKLMVATAEPRDGSDLLQWYEDDIDVLKHADEVFAISGADEAYKVYENKWGKTADIMIKAAMLSVMDYIEQGRQDELPLDPKGNLSMASNEIAQAVKTDTLAVLNK